LLSRGATEDEINRQRQLYKAHTMHDVSRGPPQQDPYAVYVRSPYHPSGAEAPYLYRGAEGPPPPPPNHHDPRSPHEAAMAMGSRAPAELVPGVVFSAPTPPPRHPTQQGQEQQQQQPPPHRPPPPPAAAETPKRSPAKTYHTIKVRNHF